MRSRIVAAIALVVLAVILVGCGGGDQATTTEDTTQAQGTAAPPAPVATPEVAPVDKSPTETVVYEPFPRNEQTPQVITQRLDAKQPMLVFFFDSTQKDSNDQRDAIAAVMDKYRGAIDLVSFDVAAYVTTLPDGSIAIDPAFASDPAAQQTAALASQLKVKYTPYIVLTDSEGYIVGRYRGFVDAKDLELGVLRATS